MADTVTLTPKARELLDELLVLSDITTPRAFTEGDMVELALRVFKHSDGVRAPQIEMIFILAIMEFELSRLESNNG